MPFYQSIADILSENRQDKHAILSRPEQIIGALDGLGREEWCRPDDRQKMAQASA